MIINENYKIESDALNVTLFYRSAGKKTWIPIGYYSELRYCLEKLINLEIMGTGMEDFKTVCKKIDELTAMIITLKGPPRLVECLTRVDKPEKSATGQVKVALISATG